jgi:hypothetical protein
LETHCTTLVPIPSFRPILRIPSPLAFSSSIRASIAGSTPSSHDLSLAAFTINIAESNFRHTQVKEQADSLFMEAQDVDPCCVY